MSTYLWNIISCSRTYIRPSYSSVAVPDRLCGGLRSSAVLATGLINPIVMSERRVTDA